MGATASKVIHGFPEHRDFEPLSVRGSAAEDRIAHALEAIAGALCRIDHRLSLLVERDVLK